jgi:hypothetical protein
MLPRQVALVSEVTDISASELALVSAALQKQATRDFGPTWGVPCTVDSFARLEDVPVGYWPILVMANINQPGASGVHSDQQGQPFALVQYSNSWSLTASHECLEMLADPFGNRLVAGPSTMPNEDRVEYLAEACDPCEDASFAYTVNGVMVSDFITPHYYDPVASAGVQYSFTGAIPGPRQVLQGGYLSWHDPVSDHWWQAIFFGAELEFKDLGVMTQMKGSLRETIDALTPHPQLMNGLDPNDKRLQAARGKMNAAGAAANARARGWRKHIEALRSNT